METIFVAVALMLILLGAGYCVRGWALMVEEARHEAASAERIP